jgi:hypothetical protein
LKYLSPQFFLVFSLILGVSLLGIFTIDIFRVNARDLQDQSSIDNRFPNGFPATVYVIGSPSVLQQTPLAFPTLSPTATLLVEPVVTTTPLGLSLANSDQDVRAFIHAPPGLLPQPYVILTAFDPILASSVEIRGYENLREFMCTSSPCALPLNGSSTISFKAYSSSGSESSEVVARVRVENKNGGYYVIIESVNQYALYRDTCSNIWNVKDEIGETWARFPETPFQLNTDKKLHLLAARLIESGIVDARDCQGGGLGGANYPTGCGIARANEKMIEWQNQFDFKIWSTSLDMGIPPRILKSLLEYESQYWPSNQRFYVDEIGLGQINQLGIDVLLRQDPSIYNKVCPSLFTDCSRPYTKLEPKEQAIVRGAVLNSIDATCPNCINGFDLVKANESIPLIAELIQANCNLVDYFNSPGKPAIEYEDLWKFTMASYHSGFSCIHNAVTLTREDGKLATWENVSLRLKCKGTEDYVNGFWGTLVSFDAYLLDSDSVSRVQVAPTFIPKPTPIPPPTEISSSAKVWVRVYLDANNNGIPEDVEMLDGIKAELSLRNGALLSGSTFNGNVIFDMAGYPPGVNAIVRLPGLYREKMISLPEEGIVQVDFVFTVPDIPNELP